MENHFQKNFMKLIKRFIICSLGKINSSFDKFFVLLNFVKHIKNDLSINLIFFYFLIFCFFFLKLIIY